MSRRSRRAAALACCVMVLSGSAGANASVPLLVASTTGRYVVGFRHDVSASIVDRLVAAGATTVMPLSTIDAVVIAVPAPVIDTIARFEEVEYVEPDGRVGFTNYQTEEQTGEGAVRAGRPPLPHPLTGKGVTVAVVDLGVDPRHPDLADRVVDRLTFDGMGRSAGVLGTHDRDLLARSHPAPQTVVGTHGLSVAGVIAGTGKAAAGVDMRGMAPKAKLVDYVTCCSGIVLTQVAQQEATGSDMLLVYDHMIRHRNDPQYPGGIRVASNQWGFLPGEPFPRNALTAILRKAIASGISVVFSAGNYGPEPNTVDPPATLVKEIITMGVSCPAIDGGAELLGEDECGAGEIRYYSARGPSVDLAAPGAGIWAPKYVTALGNQDFALPRPGESDPLATANNRFWYGKFGGTSAAAPYVSGVIALMLEANPRLRPAQIDAILKRTARDFGPRGWDPAWGFGEVNAFAAAVAAAK